MKMFFLIIILIPFSCFSNPFLLPIFKNDNINIDDWNHLQTELRKNDIESLVTQYYSEFLNQPNSPADPNKFPCDSFIRRAKIGMDWTFVDKDNK